MYVCIYICVYTYVYIYIYINRDRLKDRARALVMFASVIKHRLNKPNTAAVLARIEDTMS
jgi:hypothetical protein